MNPLKKLSRLWLIPVVLLVFVAGLAAGILSLSYFQIGRKQRELRNEAISFSYYFISLSAPAATYTPAYAETTSLYYDVSGECIGYRTSLVNSDLDQDFREIVQSYLAEDAAQETDAVHLYTQQLDSVFLIYCRPSVINSAVVGYACIVGRLTDLPVTLLLYSVVYTALFCVFIAVILVNNYYNHRLTQIRQNYVSNISHDLKSPIASCKALTETLSDGLVEDATTQAQYYGIMLRELNRLERFVSDMLELSRIQSGMDFHKSRQKTMDILGEIIEKYTVLCDELDIHFIVDESLSALPTLNTDKACCVRILDVLLDNATKFVDIGGTIRLAARADGKKIILCVEDDGIGISKADQEKIFQRFYSISSERNRSGTGLGLAIAQEMCTGMKERIWVESRVGYGTRFCFTVCA